MKKADELVTTTLTLPAGEARWLRDELYCAMSQLEPEFPMASFGGVAPSFADYVETQRAEDYARQVVPVLEKMYVALRTALNQSATVPRLHGPYTQRRAKKVKPVRELLRLYVNETLSWMRTELMGAVVEHETDGAYKDALKRLGAKAALRKEGKLFFRFATRQGDVDCEVKDVYKHIVEHYYTGWIGAIDEALDEDERKYRSVLQKEKDEAQT